MILYSVGQRKQDYWGGTQAVTGPLRPRSLMAPLHPTYFVDSGFFLSQPVLPFGPTGPPRRPRYKYDFGGRRR